jgi:hypothetical protein
MDSVENIAITSEPDIKQYLYSNIKHKTLLWLMVPYKYY